MMSQMLIAVGILFVVLAGVYAFITRRRKAVEPVSNASVPRSIILSLADDDLRAVDDGVESTGPVEVRMGPEPEPAPEPKLELEPEPELELALALAPAPEPEPPPLSDVAPAPALRIAAPIRETAPAVEATVPVAAVAVKPPIIPALSLDDDGPVDFSGIAAIDESERRRLLAQLEAEPPVHLPDEEVAVATAPASAEPAASENSDDPVEVRELRRTYEWPQFIGRDAQSLGDPEREVLIRMLRTMRDPSWCLPVLMSAFNEESADGLRPRVLEALVSSYHGTYLQTTYEYCLEFGNPEEQALAAGALDTLLLSA